VDVETDNVAGFGDDEDGRRLCAEEEEEPLSVNDWGRKVREEGSSDVKVLVPVLLFTQVINITYETCRVTI
jgi:hypothetical protein